MSPHYEDKIIPGRKLEQFRPNHIGGGSFDFEPQEHIRRIVSAEGDSFDRVPFLSDSDIPDYSTADFETQVNAKFPGNFWGIVTARKAALANPPTHNGLVKRWTVWGDQDGNDAEVYTGVQVELEDVKVELETPPKQGEKDDAVKAATAMAEAQLGKPLPVKQP